MLHDRSYRKPKQHQCIYASFPTTLILVGTIHISVLGPIALVYMDFSEFLFGQSGLHERPCKRIMLPSPRAVNCCRYGGP